MGKTLVIRGADFHVNAIDDPSEREGQVISNIWVTGTFGYYAPAPNYKVVAFPVTPGESYHIETDRTSTAFAFSTTLPAANVNYIGGSRTVIYNGDSISGTVPSGAAYMGVGMYTTDAGNLFCSELTIGDDVVDVSKYRE